MQMVINILVNLKRYETWKGKYTQSNGDDYEWILEDKRDGYGIYKWKIMQDMKDILKMENHMEKRGF